MQCPYCGRDNRPAAKYCAYCQSPLSLARSELRPGQTLDGGNYRVVRALGKGGMGAVYLAEDKRAFDRLRVIKEVIEYFDPADPVARRKAAERFEAEARTLAMLKHPGIPDLIAYFSEGGHNYLVMEYIEGENLARKLTREDDQGRLASGKPYPLEEALLYTTQICEVLEYLAEHQPPVVHNDIKPANIIIEKDRAVLVDFGTAKTRYAQPLDGQPDRQKVSLYGTMGYAAPELYTGTSESRSDVYALAATAYHLLTDDDPRDHPARFPKMNTLPAALVKTLQQALAADISQRLTAAQFRQQLENILFAGETTFQALTFPGGEQATSRKELIALCIKHWDYAADILYNDSITNWLNKILHDPAAAKEAKAAINSHPQDRNAGLEAFIRTLNPRAMPTPRLALITPRLDYGQLPTGKMGTQELKIRNAGGGYLHGKISSSVSWARVAEEHFGCPTGQIQAVPVTVDTSGLTPGTFYHGSLTLTTPHAQPATVPISLSIPPQILQLDRQNIDFGTIPRAAKKTSPLKFTVVNKGQNEAHCRITSVPNWLRVSPAKFDCPPGDGQEIEVRIRPKELAEDRRYTELLKIEASGARDAIVRVSLQVGRPAAGAFRGLLRLVTGIARGALLVASIVLIYYAWQSFGGLNRQLPTPSPASYAEAVEALTEGDTGQANQALAELEPLPEDQVRELAELLNGEMVQVSAGESIEGLNPPNQVAAAEFRIDKYEVTNVQYLAFVQQDTTGHAQPPRNWSGFSYPQGKALHPVVAVNWQDASYYCAWAGKRLPGNEEWEAAASGPDGNTYPGDKEEGTRPVGSYPQGASFYGALDMIGNVCEWTNDQTVHGGSYLDSNPAAFTPASYPPTYESETVGFRCAD